VDWTVDAGDIIAAMAALISILSAGVAFKALDENKKIFLRQNIIALHEAWKSINSINPALPNPHDVAAAVGAMSLTASLWNHDALEKGVLIDSYWPVFDELYGTLSSLKNPIPLLNRSGVSYLTEDIVKAHTSMAADAKKRSSVKARVEGEKDATARV
jgi:hypothetical protein